MCVERKGVFMAECKNMREKRRKKGHKTSERSTFIPCYRFAIRKF